MISPEQLAASGTEQGHQTALFAWSALPAVRDKYPELKWMFAVPNGGLRDKITSGRLKAAGLKAGIWDIFLPVPRIEYLEKDNQYGPLQHIHWCGLFIEMKKKGNNTTPEQIAFGAAMANNYKLEVCWSWIEARDAIIKYLEN